MKSLQPKLNFIKDKAQADSFADLSKNPAFADGIQAALSQYVLDLPRPMGLEEACRQNYQIEGAKDFIHYLLNLLETETPQKRPEPQNLTWNRPQHPHKNPLTKQADSPKQP